MGAWDFMIVQRRSMYFGERQPQATDPKAEQTACATSRSAATTHPVQARRHMPRYPHFAAAVVAWTHAHVQGGTRSVEVAFCSAQSTRVLRLIASARGSLSLLILIRSVSNSVERGVSCEGTRTRVSGRALPVLINGACCAPDAQPFWQCLPLTTPESQDVTRRSRAAPSGVRGAAVGVAGDRPRRTHPRGCAAAQCDGGTGRPAAGHRGPHREQVVRARPAL